MATDATTGLPQLDLKKYDKVVLGLISAALLAAAGGALYALYVIMPMLVVLAQDTVYLLLLTAAAVVLGLFGLEAWLSRDALYYKLKVIARNIRKSVIREDPIGTLDVAIERFEKKLSDIDKSRADAVAAKRRLEIKVKNTQRTGALDKADEEESLYKAATKRNETSQAQLHALQAERWRKAADGLQPTIDNMDKMLVSIAKARELCALKLDDWRGQRDVISVQLEAAQESRKAVRSFKRFMTSSSDLEMLQLSVDEIERQTTQAEAEVDQFLGLIQPQLETADLKHSADAERAVARLESSLTSQKKITAGGAVIPDVPVKDAVVVR